MTRIDAPTHRATLEYLRARHLVEELGYIREVDAAQAATLCEVSSTTFLREATWVILAAGLSDSVVRCVFPAIYSVFGEFRDIGDIVERPAHYKARALTSFRHTGKVDGILAAARWTQDLGWSRARREIEQHGAVALMHLPYLGPATARHLVKNLGAAVAKPDRHLSRAAERLGFESPQVLCEAVATVTGDPVAVIDVVFWRHAVLARDISLSDR